MKLKEIFANRGKVMEAATALSTAPCFIADIFGVSPMLVERLLRRRNHWKDNLSISENVERFYGRGAVLALKAAI